MSVRIGKSKKETGKSALGGIFSTGKNVLKGAAEGAALGSRVPGVGTKAGAVVGGIGGLFGVFGSNKK